MPSGNGGTALAHVVPDAAKTQHGGTPVTVNSGWQPFQWNGLGKFDTEGNFTFTSHTPTVVQITDAFLDGDEFEVFNNGKLLGRTSPAANTGFQIGNDPADAFVNPFFSHGTFTLPAGHNSFRFQTVAIARGNPAGEAFFELFAGGVAPTSLKVLSNGNVSFAYSVPTKIQQSGVTIGLYWATGYAFADIINPSQPLFSTAVSNAGTFTVTVPAADLTTAPAQATTLLVVGDPANVLGVSNHNGEVRSVKGQVLVTPPAITAKELRAIDRGLSNSQAAAFVAPLNAAMSEFGIKTLEQEAMFLGQLAALSNSLKVWNERGSSKTYIAKYFTNVAERTALGNQSAQEAALFHGRGPIELLGHAEYEEANAFFNFGLTFGDAIPNTNVDQLTTPIKQATTDLNKIADKTHPALGLRVAAWIWEDLNNNQLNELTSADAGKTSSAFNSAVTQVLTGGTSGLSTALADYLRARSVLLDQ